MSNQHLTVPYFYTAQPNPHPQPCPNPTLPLTAPPSVPPGCVDQGTSNGLKKTLMHPIHTIFPNTPFSHILSMHLSSHPTAHLGGRSRVV